jgi:hypothetical protein
MVGLEIANELDAGQDPVDRKVLLHEFIGLQGEKNERLGTNNQIITIAKRPPLCLEPLGRRRSDHGSIYQCVGEVDGCSHPRCKRRGQIPSMRLFNDELAHYGPVIPNQFARNNG